MSLRSDVKETKRVVEPVNVDDCGVCLESLPNTDDERTLVMLRCRHQFHLDCIGSAFNFKKSMQCPNCRQLEKGKWLLPKPEEPSYPEINFDIAHDEIGFGIRSVPDSPTMVRIDNVSSSVESYIDSLFTNSSPMHLPYAPNPMHPPYAPNPMRPPYAPDQLIRDSGNTRFDILRDDPSTETRMQRQIEEHLSLIADSERRLHAMLYEYHGITGGTGIGGESSDGDGVTEEATGGTEMTEE